MSEQGIPFEQFKAEIDRILAPLRAMYEDEVRRVLSAEDYALLVAARPKWIIRTSDGTAVGGAALTYSAPSPAPEPR